MIFLSIYRLFCINSINLVAALAAHNEFLRGGEYWRFGGEVPVWTMD